MTRPSDRTVRSELRDPDRAKAEAFMGMAIREAEKGTGRTSPNPVVGAVIVKDGRVIARGHHARAGGPHAEAVALRAAGPRSVGADLYSTLEPCDHWGKTPPCAVAICEAGIRRVFVGSRDPHPLVNGRGIARLRKCGVEVIQDILRGPCDRLNEHWFAFVATGRPFVTLKVAMTLDGKIATSTGDSRWVTGEEARLEVHRMRDRVDAVLVGGGTARVDDPLLTTRLPGGRGRDPIRIVLDEELELPQRLKLFHPKSLAPTIVATSAKKARSFAPGVDVLRCRAASGGIDLRDLLRKLGARGITHLMVEGGAEVHTAFLRAGLADRVAVFVAPRLLGGGMDWFLGPGPRRMKGALELRDVRHRSLGDDLLITGVPVRSRARSKG